MAEQIAGWFVQNLGGVLSPEAIVFIVSLLPILELRGGIIAGFLMGLSLKTSFIICLLYTSSLFPQCRHIPPGQAR